jgi:hypothetical protein
MKSPRLLPDQLNTWSDNYAPHNTQTALVCLAEAETATLTPTAPARSLTPRLPHRTLQTLRQSRMQMRSRSRSWPKVLPLRKSSRTTSANGLRAAGFSAAGYGISRSLPSASPGHRGNLRNQWRTPAPARGLVRNDNARTQSTSPRPPRYAYGGYPSHQYARRLAKAGTSAHTGGRQ